MVKTNSIQKDIFDKLLESCEESSNSRNSIASYKFAEELISRFSPELMWMLADKLKEACLRDVNSAMEQATKDNIQDSKDNERHLRIKERNRIHREKKETDKSYLNYKI